MEEPDIYLKEQSDGTWKWIAMVMGESIVSGIAPTERRAIQFAERWLEVFRREQ